MVVLSITAANIGLTFSIDLVLFPKLFCCQGELIQTDDRCTSLDSGALWASTSLGCMAQLPTMFPDSRENY